MSDPALALQGAIVAYLRAEPGFAAIAAGRVYDTVPPNAEFPYVTLGEDDVQAEIADGYDGSTVTVTLHGWSRAVGFPEVKRLAAAVRQALHGAPLALPGHHLVDLSFGGARYLRDPDGQTSHAVLTLTALTEPAD